MNEIIRKPAVAGLFYPKNADALKSMITDLLSKTKMKLMVKIFLDSFHLMLVIFIRDTQLHLLIMFYPKRNLRQQ